MPQSARLVPDEEAWTLLPKVNRQVAVRWLVVLPARSGLANSSEILAGPRSRELVTELRSRYPERIIIYDLPPVLTADDALAFAPLVECGLVVAAEGRTRRQDLVRAIELLSKTPLVGTVLNRATDAPSGY